MGAVCGCPTSMTRGSSKGKTLLTIMPHDLLVATQHDGDDDLISKNIQLCTSSDAMIIQCRHKSRENSAQSWVKVQIKWSRIPHAHFYLLLSLTLIPHDLKLLLDRLAQPAQSCKAALQDFFNL